MSKPTEAELVEALEDAIPALEDLGACDDDECPGCPRVLPRLRALLSRYDAKEPKP